MLRSERCRLGKTGLSVVSGGPDEGAQLKATKARKVFSERLMDIL